MTQLKAEPLAAHARYGSAALREKTKAFAAALNDLNFPEAISRFGRLMVHRGPVLNRRSELRCRMSVRLVSWLTQNTSAFPSSLNSLSEQYWNEIARVDWAQTVLLEGDDSVDLANAYALLRENTRTRRDLFDRLFHKVTVTAQGTFDYEDKSFKICHRSRARSRARIGRGPCSLVFVARRRIQNEHSQYDKHSCPDQTAQTLRCLLPGVVRRTA